MRKANERAARHPLPANHRPADSIPRRVTSKDSWVTLAAEIHVDPWDLIAFNFETRTAVEVNWYLRRNVGCREGDGKNYRFSDGLNPGIVYLPLPGARVTGAYKVPHAPAPLAAPSDATGWAALGAMLMAWKMNSRLTVEEAMARAGANWTTILAANRALEWHETISFVSACGLKVKSPQSRSPWGWRAMLRQLGPVAVVLSNPFAAWIVVGLAGGTAEWGMIEYLDLQGNYNVADFPHLQGWLEPGPGRQVQLWHA